MDYAEFVREVRSMIRTGDLARLVADYSSDAPEPIAA